MPKRSPKDIARRLRVSRDIYFDRDGSPLDADQLHERLEDPAYRRVAESNVGFYWVSTVWLGINHAFDDGPPVIFETMIFSRADRELNDIAGQRGLAGHYQERYRTEAKALAGHARIVAALEAGTLELDREGW